MDGGGEGGKVDVFFFISIEEKRDALTPQANHKKCLKKCKRIRSFYSPAKLVELAKSLIFNTST